MMYSINYSVAVMVDGAVVSVRDRLKIRNGINAQREQEFLVGRHGKGRFPYSRSIDSGISRLVINEW